MKYRWSINPPQPLLAQQLAGDLKITALLAQCLLNRGLCDAGRILDFLDPRLKHLADPFLLPNMHAAVDRLLRARETKECVVIFGDYDVDGVTSSALLLEVLEALGWNVSCYLPHRLEEGYGLTSESAENCLRKCPATLLIAVDCGSTAVEPIDALNRRGVDVIVLDHHQVLSSAPRAVALVNPHLHSDGTRNGNGDFRELCSVGIAFKLAHALVKRCREIEIAEAAQYDLRTLLDLVALGTIADLVPLIGENRILVSAGLARLDRTQRPGLVALKNVARAASPIGTYEVGFQLAPRLNAAGRLETAEEALRLLRSASLAEAMPIAQALDTRNRERQKIERTIAEEVIGAIRARFNPDKDFVIVEGQLLWHVGVVGIVASRVLQEFYRPTIIVGGEGEIWRGSGRSIAGFDLAAALRECGDLLSRHGGHAMAAGLSLVSSNLPAFRERLNDLARRMIKAEDLHPPLRLDADVSLDDINLGVVRELGRLRPLGQGNPSLQFCARRVTHHRPLQRIGAEKQHVKMWLRNGATVHEAVWWGAGNKSLPVDNFDVAFSPQINAFNGQESVQLKILDWRPSEKLPSLL